MAATFALSRWFQADDRPQSRTGRHLRARPVRNRLTFPDTAGATLDALTARREVLDGLIASHGGRIANTAGDSVLAEFGSAVDAVRCAMEAQGALAKANSTLPETRHINFRIGVHVGDVMVRAGDLFGDGVNIARDCRHSRGQVGSVSPV